MSNLVETKQLDKLLTALDSPANPVSIGKRLLPCEALQTDDYHFFQINSLTHISDAPRREALENVYSCIRYPGASVVYLLAGNTNGITLYLGVARNYLYPKPVISISDISTDILKPSFEGNFRGSDVSQATGNGSELIKKFQSYHHVGVLQGTVGDQSQGENAFFQGVDRLVDVMSGSEFCLMITASCLASPDMVTLEQWMHRGYELLAPLARVSLQQGQTTGRSLSWGRSKGESKGTTKANTTGSSQGESEGTSKSTSRSDSSESGTEGTSNSTSKGTSDGTNESTSKGTNSGASINRGETLNISAERHNRHAQQWLSYLDEVLLPRVDYGRSRGGFVCNIALLANSQHTLLRLGDVSRSIFSGNMGNQYPLQMLDISSLPEWVRSVKNFQIPVIPRQANSDQALSIFDSLKSRVNLNGKVLMGAYVTPKELSLIAGLPQQEVVGLELKEQVSFGLNPPYVSVVNGLPLGSLVQDGRVLEHKINLDRRDLNKHVFVAGVTGSGKTTTCHHLLRASMLPFLVIEPVKTEYRMLLDQYDDLLVLTPGRDDLAPLKLNPLEMMPGETISSRVDIIKASFSASFDMEAAIPQILEAALYRCYENMGWDLSTSTHPLYTDPFASGCYPFPILRDLLSTTEQIVKEQGFDDRLRQDYIGSIKARLQGLLLGAKGQIFNTLRSIDFSELIQRRVVIELEEIRNGAEKSLLIAFIMTNVIQALKNEHRKNPQFRHLTLIEEAHHLLTKADPSTSNNRRQAIEMFADMLAEVRKYGEGLIIVDQIPNKLTPEVLKNTNTKIIHKLFAEDDKVAIGNTMALEPLQQQHLSRLGVGQAVVFSQGWQSSVLIQVETTSTTKADIPLNVIEPELRKRAWQFYQLPINLHLLPLQAQQPTLSIEEWRERLAYSADTKLLSVYTKFIDDPNETNRQNLASLLEQAFNRLGSTTMVIEHIIQHLYIPTKSESMYMWRERLQACYPLFFCKGARFIKKENLMTINRRIY